MLEILFLQVNNTPPGINETPSEQRKHYSAIALRSEKILDEPEEKKIKKRWLVNYL